MITVISPEKMKNIAPLFEGWDETLIWSCLQGHMGRAWADDVDMPSAAQIITGDFCFFAGNANTTQAKELVCNIPDDYSRPWILIIPEDETWHGLIEDVYINRFNRYMRYAIKKEPHVFDKDKLQGFIDALPKEYCIVPIDERLYHLTQSESWSGDFCSQFPSFTDYHKYGLGYVVLYEEKPVCGASSYIFYDSGIEIEIGTVEAHRRKGLAAACAAKLILECLDRNLYPSWDAANRESVALAEKLGYRFHEEYVTYGIMGLT